MQQPLSLDEVLPRLLDGLFDVFPQGERGFVLLSDPTSRRLLLRARKTRGQAQAGPLRLSLSLIDRVVHSRRAILSAVAASDSRRGPTGQEQVVIVFTRQGCPWCEDRLGDVVAARLAWMRVLMPVLPARDVRRR